MKFTVKEWPDKSASLLTENGYNLATFSSMSEAHKVYGEWRKSQQAQDFRRPDAPLSEAIRA